MNSRLKVFLFIILLYLISGFLAFILSPLGGVIHSNLLNLVCISGFFWNIFDTNCSIEGFAYFFVLILSFSSFLFFRFKKAFLVFLIGSSFFWINAFLMVFGGSLKSAKSDYSIVIFVMLVFSAIGYLLALGANKIRKRVN